MNIPKLIRSKYCLIGLIALYWCIGLGVNAAPADEIVVLTQKSQAIGGIHTVYLSKNSVRIECPTMIIFAQAPNWSVIGINPLKKIYIQADYKTGLKLFRMARTPFSVIADTGSLKWRKARGEVIASLSTDQWLNQSDSGGQGKNSVKCWTAQEPQFAPQCAEIMATCYGIPSIGHGIPLRVLYTGSGNSLLPVGGRYYDEDSRRQQEFHWLDTSAMKKTHASTALFTIPKGFKRTNKYEDIAVQLGLHNADIESVVKDLAKHPETLFNSR